MNNEILSQLNSDRKEYLSINIIVDDENGCLQNSIPIEFVYWYNYLFLCLLFTILINN